MQDIFCGDSRGKQRSESSGYDTSESKGSANAQIGVQVMCHALIDLTGRGTCIASRQINVLNQLFFEQGTGAVDEVDSLGTRLTKRFDSYYALDSGHPRGIIYKIGDKCPNNGFEEHPKKP